MDNRLIFTHSKGIISQRTYSSLDLPLEAIADLRSERTLVWKRIVIRARPEVHAGVPRFEVEVTNPEDVAATIERQIGISRTRSTSPSAATIQPQSVSVVVHNPPVREPPPKIMMRCTYCKTVFPELDAKCPSCGAHF
jgi:hypothetical protein